MIVRTCGLPIGLTIDTQNVHDPQIFIPTQLDPQASLIDPAGATPHEPTIPPS